MSKKNLETKTEEAVATVGKKTAKLLVGVLLSALLAFTLIGCGGSSNNATSGGGSSESAASSTAGQSEWEVFINDYDAWANSYIELLEKYAADPTNQNLLTEATELMNEASEWSERSTSIQDSLSVGDLEEFQKRVMEISDKILKASAEFTGGL